MAAFAKYTSPTANTPIQPILKAREWTPVRNPNLDGRSVKEGNVKEDSVGGGRPPIGRDLGGLKAFEA